MFVKKISGVHNRHAKSSILVMSDSLVAQMVVSACNAGNQGSIPGLGRSPGEGNGYPLQYLAWRIPWTEEPGELQHVGLQRVDTTEQLVLSLSSRQDKSC